jgi:hypothetical protein
MNRRTAVSVSVMIAAAGMCCVFATPAEARDRGTIRFARGASAKTVSGTVKPGDPDCYTFSARKGQQVEASVSSRRGSVWLVLDPFAEGSEYNDLQVQINERGGRYQTLEVYRTGQQDVCVAPHNKRREAYQITIEID